MLVKRVRVKNREVMGELVDERIDWIVERACRIGGKMPQNKSELEEFYGIYIHETPEALLFVSDEQIKDQGGKLHWNGADELWLPKSQIKYDRDEKYKREDPIMVEIPLWLAKAKGLA